LRLKTRRNWSSSQGIATIGVRMDDSLSSIVIRLIIVLLVVLANGYFVAAEFAIVSVRRSRIEPLVDEGNKKAKIVVRFLDDLNTFISTCQVGVTVASLVLGWLGEETLAHLLAPVLGKIIPVTAPALLAAHSIATALALLIVTYFHLLLGEYVPKAIALEKTEAIAMAVARPMELFEKAFKFPIWLINISGAVCLRLLGLHESDEHAKAYSEDEIRHLISVSHKSGHLIEDEQTLIDNVFEFTEATVESIMKPRTEIEALDADLPIVEMVAIFERLGYSRMPVYRNSLDEAIGIVLYKDLSRAARQGQSVRIEEIVRDPVFLPTSVKLNDALGVLRKSSAHMAMVVDEHGGVEGLVTLEDLLEEIVGDISDEHDEIAVRQIVEHGDGSYTVMGSLSIRDANRSLDLGLPESDSYHTVAGFMMARAGKLLTQGQQVEYNGLRLTVQSTERNRITEARIERLAE
jgi:CBS domain containing-hemolysin-like protein